MQEALITLTADHLVQGIVKGEHAIDPAPFEIVDDLWVANRLASTQDVWEEGYEHWHDLKELAVAPVYIPLDPVVPHYKEVRLYLRDYNDRVEAALTRGLISEWPGEKRPEISELLELVAEKIMSDIDHICLSRLQYGVGYEPFETMFSAYKQGGWPCGWKGEYPEGKMVLYHIGPKV